MTATYDCIATTTASGSTNSITFSSISGTYTDLILIANAKANAVTIYCRLNSDSASNYSTTRLYGTGSTEGSSRSSNSDVMFLDYYGYLDSTTPAVHIAHFFNYANTTTNKIVLARANNAANGVNANVGLWRSTAAITSITLYAGMDSVNFSSDSTFSLYGIKAE